MSYITRNPKRSIGALATALAAVGVAVGSGATFTAQTANPATSATAGELIHTNSKNGAAILTPDNMKPGDVEAGTVTIENTGTLAGKFKLSEKNDSTTFEAGALKLKIEDVASGAQVYSGDMTAVPDAGLDLGTYAVGEKHTYRFTITLDQNAGNANQGKKAQADYVFDEVQA